MLSTNFPSGFTAAQVLQAMAAANLPDSSDKTSFSKGAFSGAGAYKLVRSLLGARSSLLAVRKDRKRILAFAELVVQEWAETAKEDVDAQRKVMLASLVQLTYADRAVFHQTAIGEFKAEAHKELRDGFVGQVQLLNDALFLCRALVMQPALYTENYLRLAACFERFLDAK